jgi:hypothetical protein
VCSAGGQAREISSVGLEGGSRTRLIARLQCALIPAGADRVHVQAHSEWAGPDLAQITYIMASL